MPGDYPPRAGTAVSGGHEDSSKAGPAVSGGGFRGGLRLASLLATSALAGPLLTFAAHADEHGELHDLDGADRRRP
ncbi:hypothetical protein EOD04_27010, partial [Mesorhizobium sp. M2C.T.Ca.TU.009.01.2.1]